MISSPNRVRLTAVCALMLCSAGPLSASESTLSTLGCMLEPSEKVDVSSPVPGVLDKVAIKRGDLVKKGDVLFKLKAGVEQEQVDLVKAKADFAERKAKRNQELYKDDILTMHERDEIETELLLAKTELRLKQEELALRTVKSPIKGVVVNRLNTKGEYVNVEPVVQLANLDPLHIDLLLPASYFGKITKGQELLIKPEAEMIAASPAKVDIVDPLIDPASGTFRVQLVMANPGNKIPAGLRCSAQTQPQAVTQVAPK